MPKSIYTANQEALQTLLKKVRKDAGMSQVQLAQTLGRPQSFVSKYEAGERRLDILELRELCHALGTTLASFIKKLERRISQE